MTCYELADTILKVVGLSGGVWALYTWRESQRWKRAAQLDVFIKTFEGEVLIQQATRMLDWQMETIKMADGRAENFNSNKIVDALRLPEGADSNFGEVEVRIRDAFDALLSFLGRLELAMQGGFVDKRNTLTHFRYWIRRLWLMDQHTAIRPEAKKRMRAYENNYGPGDEIIESLFARISQGRLVTENQEHP